MSISKQIVTLALVFMMSVHSRSIAQSYVGGSGFVNAGYMWTPSLSSTLQSAAGNSVNFQKGYALIGGELNYRDGNAVVELSGYFGTQEGQPSNGQIIEPFLWKTSAGLGWIVTKNKFLFVYPLIGLGTLESSLIYHRSTDSDVRAVTRSVSVDCSVQADYFLNSLIREEGFFSAAIVSLRLNYTKGLSDHELQGISVTVCVGGIAFMKRKKQ